MKIIIKNTENIPFSSETLEVSDDFKKAVEVSTKNNKNIKPNIIVYLFNSNLLSSFKTVKAIWSYDKKDDYNSIAECDKTTCELEIKYKDSYELICKKLESYAAIRIAVNAVGKNFSRKQLISEAFNDLIVRTLNDQE